MTAQAHGLGVEASVHSSAVSYHVQHSTCRAPPQGCSSECRRRTRVRHVDAETPVVAMTHSSVYKRFVLSVMGRTGTLEALTFCRTGAFYRVVLLFDADRSKRAFEWK